MKDRELQERLSQPAPRPSPETMESAWQAVALEFHRSTPQEPARVKVFRLAWPAAIAACLAFLCGLLLNRTQETNTPVTSTKPSSWGEVTNLFEQGQALFGNQLQAVTVSKDRVVWHLSDNRSPGPPSGQLVTASLKTGPSSELQIATLPGVPVDLDLEEKTYRVEFLPDETDNIMAIGDGIFWSAQSPESPMTESLLQEITPTF